MKLSISRILTLLPLAVLLFSWPLRAQFDRGTITGKVIDPSGAVAPGVEVTATNTATGVVTQTATNEVGLYTLSNIPIGNYEIKFALAGFKTFTRAGIELTVAQTLRLDVSLETGQITETVTVQAAEDGYADALPDTSEQGGDGSAALVCRWTFSREFCLCGDAGS
jgi:Carboxypeptidase regulatory-like domain